MSRYFKEYEYECGCGCGIKNMSQAFLLKMDEVREIAGVPMVPTSGCRCESHNKAVGGSSSSSHLASDSKSSCAMDIATTSSHSRYAIISACIKAGINRIGISKTFVHVDDDKSKSPMVAWVY